MVLKKLNLGCGQFYKKGYVNIDIDLLSRPDVICDLSSFPYPFKEGYFDLIEAEHLLEHFNVPFMAMRELHRLLKDGGELIIKVPHFSRGFTHPDHKRGFDVSFPYYFFPQFKGGYAGVEFELKKMRLRWFAQPYLKKSVISRTVYLICRAIGYILDFLANISLAFCSRCWIFLVGGFEEIEFHFIKPKKE